jgi:RNA polymerase sigma-70 factor, ECF subfamily
MKTLRTAALDNDDDSELAQRIGRGDHAAFERLMRRHNSKLFRVARAILRDDADAEDALQEAYLDAFRHIREFRGAARLSTWLTRIVVNHALMRRRKQARDRAVVAFGEERWGAHQEGDVADEASESPATSILREEVRKVLERKIDELPLAFRTVFVMRDVEDMTVQETAECLSIPPATVRTRLFRARTLLREALARDMDAATVEVFGFAGDRCDRIVTAVLDRLRHGTDESPSSDPSNPTTR